MIFNVIGFENKELWSKIVKNGEIYYQWEYVDAFFKNGDGIPKLAYAQEGLEYVYNVFLLRDIAHDLELDCKKYKFFDIITPYGYGGVNANTQSKILIDFFFEKFEEYCINNNIISEFVRLNPLLNNQKFYNIDYNINKIAQTIFIKLDNPDQIWCDMESRARNTIRKARSFNLKIKYGFNKEFMDEFKEIYKDTMYRDSADLYYFFNNDFYESILKNLKDNARIYTVYFNNKPINSNLIIFNGNNAHYHLSGTLSDYMKLGANSFALYEISLDLYNKGFKKFHLGGGYGGDNSPLFKFKKSFNKFGELDFYIGKKIFNINNYKKLFNVKNIEISENYFPAYRRS